MQSPLRRPRVGTGALYVANKARGQRLPRAVRRSAFVRADNRQRAWAQSASNALSAAQEQQLRDVLKAWRLTIAQILDTIEDVAGTLERHRRLRKPLPPGWLAQHDEAFAWFLVMHTVGLVDRGGVWLAQPLW